MRVTLSKPRFVEPPEQDEPTEPLYSSHDGVEKEMVPTRPAEEKKRKGKGKGCCSGKEILWQKLWWGCASLVLD